MGLVCQSGAIPLSSNGNYQSESSVFSQQSNGAVTERVQRFGGQDKTALRAVPVPSRQPEPLRKVARSHPVNTKSPRIQKHRSTKRKTVHLVLWVNPIVKAALQRIAKQEGTEASQGLSEQGIPLMTAQEIKQMPDEGIMGFHRQLPPFRATRMDWRHFPVLTERQAMPPPELSMLPDLAEPLPALRPQSNGQLNGFINPDMTG
jgi:hypothetical protein